MKPLNDKTQGKRGKISETRTLSAPTGGWHVGSPMASAPVGTCFQLENAFPELDFIRMRGGSTVWATGMTGVVTALLPWTDGNTKLLFACNGGNIYDITAQGAVGAPLVSGLDPNAIMTYVQFTGLGIQYLLACNGVNPVQLFTGAVWTTAPAITGLTGNQLSYLWSFKNRLYGIEANSQNVWYLGLNAIGGPATIFPLAPFLSRGGKLLAGGTWAQLTANGITYNWAVVSSEGEVITYTGGSAATADWQQTGCYRVSRPLGVNCLLQAGGDLAIMTEDGIVSLASIQTQDQVALQNKAVTQQIGPAWRDAVISRAGLTGYQIIIWPLRSMVVVNMPQINAADRTQFIANGRTGAWCRYTGWDARSWAVSGVGLGLSVLYYGTSDGRVMKAEDGGMDDGKSYGMTVFTSYTDLGQLDIGLPSFGQASSRKKVTMVSPKIQTNFVINPKITINSDFDQAIPSAPAPAGGPVYSISGVKWNVAQWKVDVWPVGSGGVVGIGGIFQYKNWVPVFADAQAIGLITQVSVQSLVTPDIRLTSTDILYEQGNIFG